MSIQLIIMITILASIAIVFSFYIHKQRKNMSYIPLKRDGSLDENHISAVIITGDNFIFIIHGYAVFFPKDKQLETLIKNSLVKTYIIQATANDNNLDGFLVLLNITQRVDVDRFLSTHLIEFSDSKYHDKINSLKNQSLKLKY